MAMTIIMVWNVFESWYWMSAEEIENSSIDRFLSLRGSFSIKKGNGTIACKCS